MESYPPSAGNPFTPGVIVPPERFVGRQHELSETLARLEGMLSISLVGDARIGKSSLLKYLEARLPALLSDRYLAIYFSMDRYKSQASFCRAVLDKLLPHVVPPEGKERALRVLEQRLKRTHR